MDRARNVLRRRDTLLETIVVLKHGDKGVLRCIRLHHTTALGVDARRSRRWWKRLRREPGCNSLEAVELGSHGVCGARLGRAEDERDRVFAKDAVACEPPKHLPTLCFERVGGERDSITAFADRDPVGARLQRIEPLPVSGRCQELVIARRSDHTTVLECHLEYLPRTDFRHERATVRCHAAVIVLAVDIRGDHYAFAGFL